METKIATSIVQSKKLLKLGLKPETADMVYLHQGTKDNKSYYSLDCHPWSNDCINEDIAAWSLSALLDLMPYTIELCEESPIYVLGIYRNSDGYAIDYWNAMNGNRAALYKGSELLDVVVEMIEWLLENKYITKVK